MFFERTRRRDLLAEAGGAVALYLLRGYRFTPMSGRLLGTYDSFTYGQSREGLFPTAPERLRAIKAARMDLVLNYGTGTMSWEDLNRYADEAAAVGLRVIWNPWDSPTTWLPATLSMAHHPATWGYYVGDEAPPLASTPEAKAVRYLAASVKGTGKPGLYVSRPGRAALGPYDDVTNFVGPDCYPIGKPSSFLKPDPDVGVVAEWAGEMVRAEGRKLAMVLQAFSWSVDYPGEDLPWPTQTQMAKMRIAAVRRGDPRMILWFAMHAITDYHPDPERYWAEFSMISGHG